MEVQVAVEGEIVEASERGRRPFDLRERDGPVDGHDRRACESFEPAVENGDLIPVPWLLRVEVGDRCLHEIRTGAPYGERALEHLPRFGYLRFVPESAVLLAEEHELASAEARSAT